MRVRTIAVRTLPRAVETSSLHGAANRSRAARYLSPLEWDERLAATARAHAADLVSSGLFSHTGSDGSSVLQRVRRRSGWWAEVGENLAIGQQEADEVVDGWLASPAHRALLLEPSFTHTGAATARPPEGVFSGGLLWVQLFGRPLFAPST